MSGEVFFFGGRHPFYIEHSKRGGMFVGALPATPGPILMSLGRVGVTWRSGEAPERLTNRRDSSGHGDCYHEAHIPKSHSESANMLLEPQIPAPCSGATRGRQLVHWSSPGLQATPTGPGGIKIGPGWLGDAPANIPSVWSAPDKKGWLTEKKGHIPGHLSPSREHSEPE